MLKIEHEIRPRECEALYSVGFRKTNGSSISIQTNRPSDSQQNNKKKRTCWIVDFALSVDHKEKFKESGEKRKIHRPCWRTRKIWNLKMTVILILIGALGTVTTGFFTDTGGLGNYRTSRDHPNNCINEIINEIKKSPGDMKRLAVTQTLMEHRQLTRKLLIW